MFVSVSLYKLNPKIEYSTDNQPARIDIYTSTSYIYGFEALLGIGGGAFVQAGYAVIQAVVAPEDLGYAVSFMMVGMYNPNHLFPRAYYNNELTKPAQIGGIALGLAIASAVFVNGATLQLQDLLPQYPKDQLQAAISGTSSQVLQTLSPELRERALTLIVSNMDKVYVCISVTIADVSGLG